MQGRLCPTGNWCHATQRGEKRAPVESLCHYDILKLRISPTQAAGPQLRHRSSVYKDSVLWKGTGQAPRDFTGDLFPTLPFVKRSMSTEALYMSSSAHPTCSSLMASRANPATQEMPLLEGNLRVRGTKKNLAKPSKMAKINEENTHPYILVIDPLDVGRPLQRGSSKVGSLGLSLFRETLLHFAAFCGSIC